MNLNLSGKVVLVTSSDQLAVAIARALASEGALAVILDHPPNQGTQVVEMAGVELIAAELSSAEGCESTVQSCLERFKRMDALVDVAPPARGVSLEHGSTEKFADSLDQSLLPFYSIAHFAVPHLKEARGSIVNIASPSQHKTVELSGFDSANGAILALTREWAAELLAAGVRVNAVIPRDEHAVAPEKVAATVVFLLSDRAAHITAQHFFLDAGDAKQVRTRPTAEPRESQ